MNVDRDTLCIGLIAGTTAGGLIALMAGVDIHAVVEFCGATITGLFAVIKGDGR